MAEKMTIAQALRVAKKLKGEIAKQKKRVVDALVYEKGKEPAFSFEDSMGKLKAAKAQLTKISTQVAVANAVTSVQIPETADSAQAMCIAQALREMSELKDEISWYKEFSAGYSHVLQQKKETVVKSEVPTGEVLVEQTAPGRQRQKQVMKEVETTTISNITIAEAAGHIEALQERFERINIAVEQANHATRIEA